MSTEGNMCGKAQQPYYLEALEKLAFLAEEIGKQIVELESRVKAVLSGDGPVCRPEQQKELRGPVCSLDERLDCLVGQFSVRRNDLDAILHRIQL